MDPCEMSTRELAAAIRTRALSAREALDAHLRRIEEVDPVVNAVVTLDEDGARARAAQADALTAGGTEPGPLHGVPMTHKDTHDVAGMRATCGSPVYRDRIATDDDLIIARLRAAGGQRHRQDERAGVRRRVPHVQPALRHHDQPVRPLAQRGREQRRRGGGDRIGRAGRGRRQRHGRLGPRPGGVLQHRRLPAVGGAHPGAAGHRPLRLARPARGAGPDRRRRRVPAGDRRGARPAQPDRAARARLGVRDGAAGGPSGAPRRLVARLRAGRPRRAGDPRGAPGRRLPAGGWLGAVVEHACPDLCDADEVFATTRAFDFALSSEELLAEHRDLLKPALVWNIEKGLALSGADLLAAARARARLEEATTSWFGRYDLLLTPATQVLPFAAEARVSADGGGRAVRDLPGLDARVHPDLRDRPARGVGARGVRRPPARGAAARGPPERRRGASARRAPVERLTAPATARRPGPGQRFARFSRTRTDRWIGDPAKPNSSRSRRSTKRR